MPHKKSHRYLFGNGEIAELIFCLFPWSTLTGADQNTSHSAAVFLLYFQTFQKYFLFHANPITLRRFLNRLIMNPYRQSVLF